ncbi:response regulator transcription factor [Hydrogenophaga sp. RWCD_12]|uniref:response regulator transcription factor n=1 Tax=Hydrogenophaga sp. RWCD_12 TaxID=3391190 RepID=UPI00398539F3
MWNVLVCEDFTNLREALVDFLEESGRWSVRAVADGQALRQQLVDRLPDVLLLDVGLPHESGVDIARWLRSTYPGIGIVLLSGRGAPPDRLAGWRAGADAYLLKPAEMEEVELVLRSVVQRARTAASPSSPGSVSFSRQRGTLTGLSGQEQRLTSREGALLHALAMSPGVLVEMDTLCTLLWTEGEREVDFNNALFSLVRRLRRKLELCDLPPDAIAVMRGRGYRFTASLHLLP